MSLELSHASHIATVLRVQNKPVNAHHHGLLHLVRENDADFLYAIAAIALPDFRRQRAFARSFRRSRGFSSRCFYGSRRFDTRASFSFGPSRLRSHRLRDGFRAGWLFGCFFFLFSSKHRFSNRRYLLACISRWLA